MHKFRKLRCDLLLAAATVLMTASANGQTDQDFEPPKSGQESIESPRKTIRLGPSSLELPEREQNEIVDRIQSLSVEAKTISDLGNLILVVKQSKAKALGPANRKRVQQLVATAFVRRGEMRQDIATNLRRTGRENESLQILATAIKDFDDAIKADATNYRASLCRGVALFQKGAATEAVVDFTKCIELDPSNPVAWFNRGECLAELGEFEKAVQDYSKTLELRPSDIQAMTGRGHALYESGKYRLAIEDYELVSRMQPKNPIAFINQGDALQKLGEWERARIQYQEATKLENNAMGYQRLAWLLATCPDLKVFEPGQGLTLAKKAIVNGGKTAINLETLAAVHAALGNFEKAKRAQHAALKKAGAEALPDNVLREMNGRIAMYDNRQTVQQSRVDSGRDSESGSNTMIR